MKKSPVYPKSAIGLSATLVVIVLIFSCQPGEQLSDSYTYGGTDQPMGVGVDHSLRNQEVLIGVLRAKWSANSGSFTTFMTPVDNAFDRMNSFWEEASFGKVSFTKKYLTTSIIDVPKSMDYYYHPFTQRDILGSVVGDVINFPTSKNLVIKSDGDDVTITFPAGQTNRTDIKSIVDAAIATLTATPGKRPPTIEFISETTKRFHVKAQTITSMKAKIELEGDAIPYLGFGAPSLYNLADGTSQIILFSKPVDGTITFPSSMQLEITTLGQKTNAIFPSGAMNIGDIVNSIRTAFPGETLQQPFSVETIDDPSNAAKKIIVFKSNVSSDGDHGFKLLVGGTALALLGLQNADVGMIRRYEARTLKGYQSISDGFNAFAATLPAGTNMNTVFGNARMFVSIFVDDDQFRAHHSYGTFNIQGINFDVNFFAARISDAPGPVFAHETGHALSFPDLYKEPGSTMIGQEPNYWDVMDCGRCDAHPTSWLKSFHHQDAATRVNTWIDDSHVKGITPLPGGFTSTNTFILTPAESPYITTNPFAMSNPGIEVVHGIELIPTDPKDLFFIENRQKGIYHSDFLGNQVDYSKDIPSEGVIFYQARRIAPTGLADFLPVNLLSPYTNPLNAINEEIEFPFTAFNKINVKVLEKLTNPNTAGGGNTSYSYKVQVEWGEGSFYDLSISPWYEPPWETPDIWLDNRAQNDWDVYTYHDASGLPIENGDNAALNQPNRLYAKVTNLGDIPIINNVTVIWRIAIPQMVGGDITTELGRVVIVGGVPGKSSVITPPFEWRPTKNNGNHVCIKAEIVPVSGERNETLNNSAQENITHWFSGTKSPFKPVTVEFQTKNPYSDRDIDIRINVPRVPRGWTVEIEDVEFRLKPDEEKNQSATITPNLAYFQSSPAFKDIGIIAPFTANIEALTPIGDQWLPIGGISAVVDPVNEKGGIVMTASRDRQDLVNVVGTLNTSGPLNPRLDNREIHIRMEDNNGVQVWKQVLTDTKGMFSIDISISETSTLSYKLQSFFGGGRGINACLSNIVVVK